MSAEHYFVSDILAYLEEIAPLDTAESWDNVGLMIGDPDSSVTSIVLSLDADRKAYELCEATDAGLLLTHHPLFFRPVRRIDYNTSQGSLIRDFIRKNIHVYSTHTNLDKAEDGVNRALAEAVGLRNSGKLPGIEIGLLGHIDTVSVGTLAEQMKGKLGAQHIILNGEGDSSAEHVFVCGGSFDQDLVPLLIDKGIDLIITGEIGYHTMTDLFSEGIRTMAVGHDVSERIVLDSLARKMSGKFPGLGVAIARGFDYNGNVF